jgi:selenocysteine lyase/cysteine desulfurase
MDWSAVRAQFPVASQRVFLDHAAVCPIPTAAVEVLTRYAREASELGVAGWTIWSERIAEVRRRAARLVNAPSPEDVCFIPNTTTGIGLVAEGFPWRPGDNVVLAAEEYPSNQYPWLNLAGRGVEVRSVPSRGNRVHVDDVRAAMDGRTRVLSASFVQFASGFQADLDTLGGLCRERGVFFFVDAIQGLGVFPVDVRRTPIDALAADSHKWLLGPEGAGLAYIRREWIDRLHSIGVGAHSVADPFNYTAIDFRLKPHAGRYEGGALNVGGVLAMGESIGLLLNAGPAVAERVLQLTDHLCDRAASAGLTVFSSRVGGDRSGIVSLESPGRDPKALMKRCREADVIVNVRGGRLRVSPHCYNTPDDLDRFLDAVR